jgi:hypothetical protein
MTERKDLYFELLDEGDIVRLEPLEFIYDDSDLDWACDFVGQNILSDNDDFTQL